MQAERDVGVLRGISGRFLDRHAVKRDLVLALACDFAEGDRGVGKMQLGQFVHAVAVQPAFQHIGHQHRVVDGIKADAALKKHQRVIFEILAHLQHRRIFQQGL